MKVAIIVLYVAMAVWLLIAAVTRIYLQLSAGTALDALPFISGGLGILAIVLLLPAFEDWRQRF